MAFCSNCGAPLDDDAKFCPACGTANAQPKTGEEQNHASEDTVDLASITISGAYRKAFEAFKRYPAPFIGVMLLGRLLTVLAAAMSVVPIISVPLIFLLEVGIINVCVVLYRGEKPLPEHLFVAFSKNVLHFIGGMAWMALWILLWGLIPVVGIVFAVIKAYSYRFAPYILLLEPEVSATDALRRSIALTEGLKGKMFGAEMIVAGISVGILLITAGIPALSGALRMTILMTVPINILLFAVNALASMILGLALVYFYFKRVGHN